MRNSIIGSILLSVAGSAGVLAAQDSVVGVSRIVAVGDVHGDFGQFTTVLRQAGVIDTKNRWVGGQTHLVQTGDVPDRGPDSRKVMDLLMDLTPQAEKAGGRVHALIGNHEAMMILGDLRYVSPGEYEAFRTTGSEDLRDRAFAGMADPARKNDGEYQRQWRAERPLGWVEHRRAFESKGRYGAWIRQNNAVLKIDGYLFLHGGIGPNYAAATLASINNGVRQGLVLGADPGMAEDGEGPLWYRGLATSEEAPLAAHVDQVLANFGVQHIVIGHSVTAGTVMTRHQGKVIMIDVGLSAVYGGPPACLVIENGKPYTLHRGQKLELPEAGADPLPYLKAAAALDPQPSRLQKLIDQLEAQPAGAAAPPF